MNEGGPTISAQKINKLAPLLRGREVSQYLVLPPRDARRLLEAAGVPGIRIGKRAWRISQKDFQAWLARRQRKSKKEVNLK